MRQYIGSRYVPKPMGEWNATTAYEALSVVSYNGNSYTSKIPVPEGTLPTNESYWMLTGQTSVQIVDLQNRVAALEQEEKGRGVTLLVGDSFANGTTGQGTVATGGGWMDRLIRANGLTLNEDCFTSAIVSGSEVAGLRKFSQNVFANVLQKMIEKIPDEKINNVTKILVLGGTNDYNAGGTSPSDPTAVILSGIEAFMNVVNNTWSAEKRPVVKIGCLLCNSNQTRAFVSMQQKTVQAYRNCQKYGATYINNCEYVMSNKAWISTDGGHPNQTGYEQMEKYTNGLLDSNHVDVYREETMSTMLTASGDFNAPARNECNIILHNNIINVQQLLTDYFLELDLKNPVQQGTSFLATWSLGELKSDLLNVNGFADMCVAPINGTVIGNNGSENIGWQITCGQLLFINNGQVAVRIYATGAPSAGKVQKLIINPISLNLMTDLYKY